MHVPAAGRGSERDTHTHTHTERERGRLVALLLSLPYTVYEREREREAFWVPKKASDILTALPSFAAAGAVFSTILYCVCVRGYVHWGAAGRK